MTTFTPTPAFSSLGFSPSPTSQASQNGTDGDCSDTALRVPLAVLYSLIFLFGLVGNLFALWVFLFLQSGRNSVRVFLINCAVADLVLLACLPFRVFYHLNQDQWVLGPIVCKLVGNLFYMNMYVSILLLGLISLDRFLRLQGRGKARRGLRMKLWGHRQPWSWVACGVLWSLSLMGLVGMIATHEASQENSQQCFQYRQRDDVKWKAYFNALLVAFFWLVFVMVVVSYAKIASQLWRASRDKPDLPNAQRYERTAKRSFFVLFVFIVCFGPYHAFRPFYISAQLENKVPCSTRKVMDRTNEVMLLFSALNSCLDPLMYFLLSGSVRKAAFRALGHRFGPRLPFLTDATSNSSTTEFRRASVPASLPGAGLQGPSTTPRSSIYVFNSTLCRTGATALPPSGQK